MTGTTMKLRITDTGDELMKNDVYACLQEAGIYFVRQITLSRAHLRSKTWFLEHVAVNFMPTDTRFTFMKALEVMDKLEEIVLAYQTTYALVVQVLDEALGQVATVRIYYSGGS